jgi:hypothetical protein
MVPEAAIVTLELGWVMFLVVLNFVMGAIVGLALGTVLSDRE